MGDGGLDAGRVSFIVCRLRQISFGLMLVYVGICFSDVFVHVCICI